MQITKALSIREAVPADAAAILAYVDQVAGESNFLTFGRGEFSVSVEQEERLLKHYQQSDNQIFLLALREAQIVGMLNVHASHKNRLRHIGEFGMSVLRDHWGQGIGTALLAEMIAWAEATPVIRKLELGVQADNVAAIHLYQKFAFLEEGKRSRGSQINGQFYDVILMGREFD